MKKTVLYIIILVLVVATVAAIAIGLNALSNIDGQSTLLLDENGKIAFEVELIDIVPGDEKVYTIHMETTAGGDYKVKFDFEETGDISLAPFIDIELRSDDKVLARAKLSDCLAGDDITVPVTIKAGAADIDIAYIMDIEVGDEAQNKICDFIFTVSAEK